MYTHRVALTGDQGSSWRLLRIHAVDRNLAIVGFLGANTSQPIVHFPGITEDKIYLRKLFNSEKVEDHDNLIALAPWSRSAIKSWPLNRFVELAEELIRIPSLRVVILGGPSDIKSAEGFCRLESQGLINMVGKLSLRQLPELLRKMECLIGNDSSLIHLAAGVETPVVGIFGPTEPHATGPYPLSRHVVCRTELDCSPCGQHTCRNVIQLECLHTITVRSVVDAMQKLIMRHEG
jgi:ADP-heptose:LPS heptosyltransferase